LKYFIFIFCTISYLFSQNIPTLQKKEYSKIETHINEWGYLVKHIINKKYDVISFYRDGKFTDILLDQTLDHTITPGEEGRRTKINITAWGFANDQFKKLLWEINDVGYEASKSGDYIYLTTYGCCSSDNTHIYYKISDGKKFLTATSKFARLSVPNTKNKRIITFHSSNAQVSYQEYDYSSQLGILHYANENEIIQQALITGELDGLHSTPEITFKTEKEESENLSLWNANHNNDPQAINGLSAVIDFTYFFNLEIPIVKDRLDLDNVKLPNNLKIRIIPVGINYDEYLSDERFLSIESKSKEKLRLLRNEIFARHGHAFNSSDLKEFFFNKVWYQEIPNHIVSEEELTKAELSMIEKIKQFELK
jgi:hypothetical protein